VSVTDSNWQRGLSRALRRELQDSRAGRAGIHLAESRSASAVGSAAECFLGLRCMLERCWRLRRAVAVPRGRALCFEALPACCDGLGGLEAPVLGEP